jgi:Ni2+-binding GTPase involved in maturation of urease and hydrogenase
VQFRQRSARCVAVHDTAEERDGGNTPQANSVKISRRETREMCHVALQVHMAELAGIPAPVLLIFGGAKQ